MKRKTILVLGDSTSMSIGIEKEMYPFHLAGMNVWAPETRIVNCSLPGFTSADACAFFFRNKRNLTPFGAVIIYLGNCDAMSSELHKGRFTPIHQGMEKINSMLGKGKTKTKLKNRLLHFEWNNQFDGTIEVPERVEDYEYNISRVVSACDRLKIPVILVRPGAHVLFPAGIGKGNFLFYKYLGVDEKIAKQISIDDPRFNEALLLHEQGEFNEASEAYRNILLESGILSSNLEYQNIIVNNYAVCTAEQGYFEEAEYLLNQLIKERGARIEIIRYNLAQISRLKGNEKEFGSRLAEAYEADKSMYRVREPYKIAVDKIAKKFKNVQIVDIQSIVSDDCYVDHCHPLPERQKIIAQKIAEKLKTLSLTGDQPLAIENRLYNPEYSFGNTLDFHSYFKTFAPFSSAVIKNFISELKVSTIDNDELIQNWDSIFENIPKTINLAFKYYLKHPCFPRIQDAVEAQPFYPSDVGRFPEFFLVRYLIPYLRVVEQTDKLSKVFFLETGLLRKSEDFLSILPESIIRDIKKDDIIFNHKYESVRLPKIIQKVRAMLANHLKQGNQVNERMKTTIFWYFRETLRFGAHSRISMRYERILLEFMAEALAVAGVLDLKLDSNMGKQIKFLVGLLEETVQTHEHYCRQFSLARDCRDILKQYDEKLKFIAGKIEESTWQFQLSQEMESDKCIS